VANEIFPQEIDELINKIIKIVIFIKLYNFIKKIFSSKLYNLSNILGREHRTFVHHTTSYTRLSETTSSLNITTVGVRRAYRSLQTRAHRSGLLYMSEPTLRSLTINLLRALTRTLA
jgi:hypothetical protein